MAIVRRWGVTHAAGTAVVEQPAQEAINASALGWFSVIGKFERGEISKAGTPAINKCYTADDLARKMGSRIDGSFAPDVCEDFFTYGEGAGGIVPIRVTDGTEITPYVDLYSRHWGTDYTAPHGTAPTQREKVPVLRVSAKNAGRWGGRKRLLSTLVAAGSVPGAFTETTLTLAGSSFVVDEFKGALLVLVAGAVALSYRVISNTSTVITVEADSKMESDLGTPADTLIAVVLPNELLDSGARYALGVKVIGAEVDPSTNFGLEVYVNEALVKSFRTLSLDPASPYYAEKVINDDASNDYVVVDDLWASLALPVTPETRPANFYGKLAALTATKATFNVAQVVDVEDANVKVVGIDTSTLVAPSVDNADEFFAGPVRLTLTWALGATKYTVAATAIRDKSVAILALPDFTVGAGAQLNKTYDPGRAVLPKITIDHAGAVADGKTIVIDFLPVPTLEASINGHVMPDVAGKPLARLRVKSATPDSVTIESGNLTTYGQAPTQASVTGTAAGAGATFTFVVGAGTSDGFAFNVDGRGAIAGTLPAGGAVTLAAIVAAINAVANPILGYNPASATADGKVKITSGWFEGGGPASSVEIATAANDCYTVLGLTVATTRGTEGKLAGLSFPEQLGGGHDGGTPSDNDYLEALAVDDGPFSLVTPEDGIGTLRLSLAGVTSTTVQKAAITLAEAHNHQYLTNIPAATLTTQAIVDYVNDTIGRSDFAAPFFPSWVDVPDPDKQGIVLKRIPIDGQIAGLIARYARANEGYHVPAAGLDAKLSRVVALPLDVKLINAEALTPQGINPIQKKKGSFVVWGMRAQNVTAAFKQLTHRMQLSHYEWTFLSSLDWVIFMLNVPTTRGNVVTAFREFFKPEFAKGAITGNDFDDACSIKCDSGNNSQESVDDGELYADVGVRIPRFVERFVIRVSKAGVFEGTSK